MSIFDQAMNSVSSLFDDSTTPLAATASSGGSSDSGLGIIGKAANTFMSTEKTDKQNFNYEQSLSNWLDSGMMEPVNPRTNSFTPSKTKADVSVDPDTINARWQSYLKGIVDTSAVPGKLYKATGAN